jgi:hypothetical protein
MYLYEVTKTQIPVIDPVILKKEEKRKCYSVKEAVHHNK